MSRAFQRIFPACKTVSCFIKNVPFKLESRDCHLFAAELSCLKGVTTELTKILKNCGDLPYFALKIN